MTCSLAQGEVLIILEIGQGSFATITSQSQKQKKERSLKFQGWKKRRLPG